MRRERDARYIDVSDRLPVETWKPFPFSTLVDVPFSCRDEWGRDVTEATLVGADPDLGPDDGADRARRARAHGRRHLHADGDESLSSVLAGGGVIHYHGLPITPDMACAEAIRAGHAFVSFARPEQLWLAVDLCQSFAVDNGAFSAWRAGKPVRDWSDFYRWVDASMRAPNFDFAVIPDVIDGDEAANDALLNLWPWIHDRHLGAVCDEKGRPRTKLHGLRMLAPVVVESFPFSSADSTNIGQNIGLDGRWVGSYSPANKPTRAAVLRGRIESYNAPSRWNRSAARRPLAMPMFDDEVVA